MTRRRIKRAKNLFYLVWLFLFFLSPAYASAAGYYKIGDFIKIPDPLFDPAKGISGPGVQVTFGESLLGFIQIALLIVGGLAVLFLIFGGFRYITAFGNEEQTESAKKIITNAIIGLLIVITSFSVVAIITNIVIKGQP